MGAEYGNRAALNIMVIFYTMVIFSFSHLVKQKMLGCLCVKKRFAFTTT